MQHCGSLFCLKNNNFQVPRCAYRILYNFNSAVFRFLHPRVKLVCVVFLCVCILNGIGMDVSWLFFVTLILRSLIVFLHLKGCSAYRNIRYLESSNHNWSGGENMIDSRQTTHEWRFCWEGLGSTIINFPSKVTNFAEFWFPGQFLLACSDDFKKNSDDSCLSGGIALGSLCASVAANSAVGHWHQLANVQNWPRALCSRRDDAGSTCSWHVPKAGLIDIVLTCIANEHK